MQESSISKKLNKIQACKVAHLMKYNCILREKVTIQENSQSTNARAF